MVNALAWTIYQCPFRFYHTNAFSKVDQKCQGTDRQIVHLLRQITFQKSLFFSFFFIEMFGIDFQSFAPLASRVLLLDLTKPLIMRVWWDYDLLLGKQVIANWIHFRKIRVSYHISLSSIKNDIEQRDILLCMELPKQMRIERMKVILPKSGKKHLFSGWGWLCESKRVLRFCCPSRINLWQWMQYSIWMVFNVTISAKWRKLASALLSLTAAAQEPLKVSLFHTECEIEITLWWHVLFPKNYKLSNFRWCEKFFTVF